MVSDSELAGKARIRDCALRLFAENGPDAVTVRQVAACAEVSPALVLHHFTSKQGLRDAVDAYVLGIFDSLFDQSAEDFGSVAERVPQAAASFAEMMLGAVPGDSAVPAYLSRLLLSGDPAGRRLFSQWFAMTKTIVEGMATAGGAPESADPDFRAAFLLVNDLAMILLHTHVAEVVGLDPLTPEGMTRWAANAMDAYVNGVFTLPPREEPS